MPDTLYQPSAWLNALLLRFAAERSTLSVSEWCCENLVFNEPKLNGPFNLLGREYLREILDSWADPTITDMIEVMGTRTGKTRGIFGALSWRLANNPMRCLYTMPSTEGANGARSVAKTRIAPMFRATSCINKLIPTGARRHDFNSLQMILGGSIIDFCGSNSPGQLGGNPCDVVVQDEVDKFNASGTGDEADSVRLADQRAKEFSNPKRVKASTPTIIQGTIWQELLKTDIRRRFMPCPLCGNHHPSSRMLVFAWNEQFTILPKLENLAYTRWDKEALKKDGTWDLDRVLKSARAECPHCGGHIRDHHKIAMDKAGEWRPTQRASPRFRGWHLPSMYSVTVETSFGNMAVRFLNQMRSLSGVQDFVNSDLAEPYQNQDMGVERTELVSKTKIEVLAEWKKLQTVDCQMKAPYFWYVQRAWNGGNSEGLKAGFCDTWDEVEAIQRGAQIPDFGVFIDSGYGAKDLAEVYKNCVLHSEMMQRPGKRPLAIGWTPCKGIAGYKKWKEEEGGLYVPFRLAPIDPLSGSTDGGMVEMALFEFSVDFYEDILETLRAGKKEKFGFKWAVSEQMNTARFPDGRGSQYSYWDHMDGHVKKEKSSYGGAKLVREKRNRYWPDHILDTEIGQIAAANFLNFFDLDTNGGKAE